MSRSIGSSRALKIDWARKKRSEDRRLRLVLIHVQEIEEKVMESKVMESKEERNIEWKDAKAFQLESYIEAEILSTNGTTVYYVKINENNDCRCSCPDFVHHQQVSHQICKHICFLIEQVCHQRCDSYTWEHLLHEAKQRENGVGITNPGIEYKKEGKEQKTCIRFQVESECAICYEEMKSEQPIVYCSLQCGQCIHRECDDRHRAWFYAKYGEHTKMQRTCPYCRSPWIARAVPRSLFQKRNQSVLQLEEQNLKDIKKDQDQKKSKEEEEEEKEKEKEKEKQQQQQRKQEQEEPLEKKMKKD